MTRRAATWILVVPLVSSALDACGITRDVLMSDQPFGNGGSGSNDSGQGGEFTRGTGGFYTVADSSAGGSPDYGAGGGPAGTGGFLDGSLGAGGGPSTGGVNDYDPRGDERRARIARLCMVLAQRTCAVYHPSLGSRTQTMEAFETQCNQALEAQYFSKFGQFGDLCRDAWFASTDCALANPPTCPCTSSSCTWDPASGTFGPACATQDTSLQQCTSGNAITGTVGNCLFTSTSNDCSVSCPEGENEIGVNCIGAPYGAQECGCLVNGVSLGDVADLMQQGTYESILADDCRGVATALANRKCGALLDCCIAYTPPTSSGPIAEQCVCTADPTKGGYADCAAFASSISGHIVDICPRNAKVDGIPTGRDPGAD